MVTLLNGFPEATAPDADDVRIATESGRALAKLLSAKPANTLRISIQSGEGAVEEITIPASAAHLLSAILTEMSQGNALSLVPIHAELTTDQAADLLNVSRPFLVELLEKSAIPHRKVGTHRRVLLKDVIEYKRAIDRERLKTLAELTAQAQELNMGY